MTDHVDEANTWVCAHGVRHPNPEPGYNVCCGCPAEAPGVAPSSDRYRGDRPEDLHELYRRCLRAGKISKHRELTDAEIDHAPIETLREAYRELREHHIEETTKLIAKQNDLAERCDEMLTKSSQTLAQSQKLVEQSAAVMRADEKVITEILESRAADPADLRTPDHLSDDELTTWAERVGIYNEEKQSTYLRMIVDELRERRDAEAMFIDADLQLQRITDCVDCAVNTHSPDHVHRAILKRWQLARSALCELARIHRNYLRSLNAPDEGDPQ